MELTRFANYLLQQSLSAGGFSEVFLASDPQGRTVALRRLNPKFKFNIFKRLDFKRGAAIHAQMNHPCILKVLEISSYKWIPYAVVEHHEGVNLRQALVRKNEYLTDPLLVFVKILEGLAYVHRQRWMHLDFKPENVILGHEGNPKLIDFDLARPIPRKPKIMATLSGTPSYLAPEQILKEPVDERADIFALGVTAYEMFSGQKPFTGQSSAEIFRAYTDFNTPFPPPHKINPSLSPLMGAILMRCVEKKIERRYPSIAMILKDLGGIKAVFIS